MKRNSPLAPGASGPTGKASASGGPGLGLTGLIGRVLAALVTGALLVLGLMFSLVLFVIALVGGAAMFGWFWWKVRRALRQARQAGYDPRFDIPGDGTAGPPPGGGDVIEGEVVRGEWKDEPRPPG